MGRKSQIAYDLHESPYHVSVDGITYYFSSTFLLGKFTERLEMSRNLLNDSLSNRFKMQVDLRKVADITLYARTESRGFRVVFEDGREIECLNQARFAGGNVIPNN
ncbi:MAG: hypothetical protein II449_00355 [Prevotella sp.]|nr:hypothetical protein [Prevotella sp.]